jgi:hypothetical protein
MMPFRRELKMNARDPIDDGAQAGRQSGDRPLCDEAMWSEEEWETGLVDAVVRALPGWIDREPVSPAAGSSALDRQPSRPDPDDGNGAPPPIC